MKYICPICNKDFSTEEKVSKHFLKCWKDTNPHHKSKDAPRSEDVVTSKMNSDMEDFFTSLKGDDKEYMK